MGSSYDAVVFFNRNVQDADKTTPIVQNYSCNPISLYFDKQYLSCPYCFETRYL